VQFHVVRLPKGNIFSDLIEDVKSKVELSKSDAELRLFQVYNNKILKVYQPAEKIDSFNDLNGPLHIEEVCTMTLYSIHHCSNLPVVFIGVLKALKA
jgi:hypothetical protein